MKVAVLVTVFYSIIFYEGWITLLGQKKKKQILGFLQG